MMLALMFAGLVSWLPVEDQVDVPEPAVEEVVVPDHWQALADCESGNWTDDGHEHGSARWDWGADMAALPPWASTIDWGDGLSAQFHGGLQFHPDTWDWVAGMVLDDPPQFAYQATVAEQLEVAAETQRLQGWGAWPVCSVRVGLR